jgi:NDP-hexose-3-ketoreductase
LRPQLNLACIGDGLIVERALLRPNAELGFPFKIELINRNDRRRADLSAAYQVECRGRSALEAFADKTILAVYIALPNHMHTETTLAAIRSKKAIIVEKPLAVTPAEVEAVQVAAAKNKTVLIEGVMTIHHNWTAHFAEWACRHPNLSATTCITFPVSTERLNRMPPTGMGGGVWYDVACYWVQFLQATGLGLPKETAVVSEHFSRIGADLSIEISAVCDGRVVRLTAAFDRRFEASHVFHDGDDQISTPNFLRPAIANSAIMIRRIQAGYAPIDRWVEGQGYYAAQLDSFYKRVQDQDHRIEAGLFERATYVASIGQVLARRFGTSEELPAYLDI